jgi:hypothetical protein
MRVWVVRVLWALVLLGGTAGAAEPEAVSFIPQGTVKGVRQASARFAAPMVPLGDPRTTAPFDIVCSRGTSRWIDSRTWVHDFVRDLPAGIRCTFSLRPGLEADGAGAGRQSPTAAGRGRRRGEAATR